MKKVLLLITIFLFPVVTFAYVSPGKPTGFVNDFAKILTADQKNNLEAKAVALRQSSGFEVSVVTVDSLGGDSVENFATKLFAEWGIGDKKKDTGLLILVAIKDRAIRIETGYGTEGVVTDLQAGNIIRNVITPAFQAGNYFSGLEGAFDAVSSVMLKSPDAEQYSVQTMRSVNDYSNMPSILKILYGLGFNPLTIWIVIVVIFNIAAKFLGKTKSWWLGGVIGVGIGIIIGTIMQSLFTGLFFTILLGILGFCFDYAVSQNGGKIGRGGGGFWMGGGSHGGGGGGFGGFGGGMSGGGGSSGRW